MGTLPPWMAALDGEDLGPPHVNELGVEPPFVGLYGSLGDWRKKVAEALNARSMAVYDPTGFPSMRLSQLGIWGAECIIFHLYGQAVQPTTLVDYGFMLGLEKKVFLCDKGTSLGGMLLASARQHPGSAHPLDQVVECASLGEATDRAAAFMYEAQRKYKDW